MTDLAYLIPWGFNIYAALLLWQLVKAAGERNQNGINGYTLALINMIGWYATMMVFISHTEKVNAAMDAALGVLK